MININKFSKFISKRIPNEVNISVPDIIDRFKPMLTDKNSLDLILTFLVQPHLSYFSVYEKRILIEIVSEYKSNIQKKNFLIINIKSWYIKWFNFMSFYLKN